MAQKPPREPCFSEIVEQVRRNAKLAIGKQVDRHTTNVDEQRIEETVQSKAFEWFTAREGFDPVAHQDLLNDVVSEVIARWPDSFEYEVTPADDGSWNLTVHEGCPTCSCEVVFNGSIEERCQYVSYSETDDGADVCGPDDTLGAEVTHLTCGNCNRVLVPREDGTHTA